MKKLIVPTLLTLATLIVMCYTTVFLLSQSIAMIVPVLMYLIMFAFCIAMLWDNIPAKQIWQDHIRETKLHGDILPSNI